MGAVVIWTSESTYVLKFYYSLVLRWNQRYVHELIPQYLDPLKSYTAQTKESITEVQEAVSVWFVWCTVHD